MNTWFFLAFFQSAFFPQTKYDFANRIVTSGCKGDSCYYVVRVDSVLSKDKSGGAYIIYARKGDVLYKIASPRNVRTYRKCIVPGKCYMLNLESVFFPKNGAYKNDLSLAQADAIMINGATVVREQESMYDIFYDGTLENLCFKGAKKRKH